MNAVFIFDQKPEGLGIKMLSAFGSSVIDGRRGSPQSPRPAGLRFCH
jgi:hypothetical protein